MSARPPGRRDGRKPRDNRPKPAPKGKVAIHPDETSMAFARRVALSAPLPGLVVLEQLRHLLPSSAAESVRAA